MEDYKKFYTPSQEQPQQFPDPTAVPEAQPEQQNTASQSEIPDVSAIPQQNSTAQENPTRTATSQEGAFYGDPHAPTGVSYTPPPTYHCPPPPAPAAQPMNRRIYTMCAVMALLIFLLCLYCIGSDLLHSALDSGQSSSTVNVVLQMQEKPDLDPEDENVTADGEYTVKGVAELVKPSIVEVYVYSSDDQTESNLEGTGSGIIITEDGYIITNAHVVQSGVSYSVVTDEETEYGAVVIGSDSKTDLAVLKVDADGLTPAVLGNSDETYVGETVVAIGNPAGLTNTVTKGIVSAINRQVRAESNAFVMDCIQTDAAISPGNSGGALVNMYGQVIGITSSKYASDYSSTYEGLGFAITMSQALPIVEELMTQGYISGRFRIGITYVEADTEYAAYIFEQQYGYDMPEELGGLWVTEVSDECDISNTELQAYDFILKINGEDVPDYDAVMDILDGFTGGDTVVADCARIEENGEITYFTIEFKLEEDTSGNY
jgi:serine protease Do